MTEMRDGMPQTNQLAIIGRVGILLLAKSNGLFSAIKQPLDALVTAGVRIDPLLYSNALLRAGE
jgi:predicted nucleic acid-binding protein